MIRPLRLGYAGRPRIWPCNWPREAHRWVCDAALIAADRFRLPELAFVNPAIQLWETALFGVGLRTVLGVPWARAIPARLAASVVHVLGASRFLR